MKTVMVIPGAYAQIPLIKNLKLQGYKVVCVNPYENSLHLNMQIIQNNLI